MRVIYGLACGAAFLAPAEALSSPCGAALACWRGGIVAEATTGMQSSGSDSWTRFRGSDGGGMSEATTIPTEFTSDDFNWRVTLPGKGHCSPVIFGDSVFLTWVDDEVGSRTIGCLSAADGSVRWTYQDRFEPYEHHRDNSFASSTPVVDEDGVYCYWSSGDQQVVVALDHTGHKVWEHTLGSFGAQWGTASSPVLVDGVLIIANDNERAASFLAGLDPRTGEELWRRERKTERSSYSTPVVIGHGAQGSSVVFASTSHGLTCLAARDGSLLWEVDDLFQERCVGSPVLAGGLIYQFAGSGGSGKEGYAVAPPSNGGTTDATIRHRLRGGLPYVPTPVAHGPWIFLWADGGILSCVDAEKGTVIWKERLGASFYGSPVCINGNMYCMSREGELFIVAADDEYRLLSRIDLGEGSSATPAVARGVLYLRTATHLISVGGGPGTKVDEP